VAVGVRPPVKGVGRKFVYRGGGGGGGQGKETRVKFARVWRNDSLFVVWLSTFSAPPPLPR